MKDILVLLIEDNKDDEWLALKALEKIGLKNVIVASDGQAALSMLYGNQPSKEGASRTPGLIILDLKLPKIDGLDVLKRIRTDQLTTDIKVCVLTSSEDPRDKNACKELGVPFFSKPLDGKVMLNLL